MNGRIFIKIISCGRVIEKKIINFNNTPLDKDYYTNIFKKLEKYKFIENTDFSGSFIKIEFISVEAEDLGSFPKIPVQFEMYLPGRNIEHSIRTQPNMFVIGYGLAFNDCPCHPSEFRYLSDDEANCFHHLKKHKNLKDVIYYYNSNYHKQICSGNKLRELITWHSYKKYDDSIKANGIYKNNMMNRDLKFEAREKYKTYKKLKKINNIKHK